MNALLIKPIQDVILEDLVQYSLFKKENILEQLKASLDNLKEKKESPKIADIGFLTHLYNEGGTCKSIENSPVLFLAMEMKKTSLNFFKEGLFNIEKTLVKSDLNGQENIFPSFNTGYSLETVLSVVVDSYLVQLSFKSEKLISPNFMENTHSNLFKLVESHKLQQSLPEKEIIIKKIKI